MNFIWTEMCIWTKDVHMNYIWTKKFKWTKDVHMNYIWNKMFIGTSYELRYSYELKMFIWTTYELTCSYELHMNYIWTTDVHMNYIWTKTFIWTKDVHMNYIWQVLPSHNTFLLQDVFLPILRAFVWVFPHYYPKYFFLIHKIQVLQHQDLKEPNSYVNVNPHLRPIVNYRKLSIYGNLRLTFKGG